MLNRQSYFIREHVGFMKLSNTYDILDPDSQRQIGIAQERPGTLIQVLRFLINKQMLPTKIFIYSGDNAENESALLFSIQRGVTLFRSRIDILDRYGKSLGWMKSKAFSLGGAFRVHDASDNEVALVKGDWKGWNFRLLDKTEQEIGSITKKWAGVGKELFTTADNYIIALKGAPSPERNALLLAAGLAVDTVFKEK
jgi:uncharacterized protein YxjI